MHRADHSAATSRRSVVQPQPAGPAAQELIQLQRLARAGVTAAFLAPPDVIEDGPVLCIFRRATGQPCPSCGLTRSWTAVAHGRLDDGFRMHPLGPPAFLGAVLLAVTPRRWLEGAPAYPSALLPAFVAVWIGVWLIRLLSGSARRSGVAD
jgi:hypothetical protein